MKRTSDSAEDSGEPRDAGLTTLGGSEARREVSVVSRAASIHPTVFVAVGSTAIRSVELAEENLRESLGGIPPFFAFLKVRETDREAPIELRIGESEDESSPLRKRAAGQPVDASEIEDCLRVAVESITAYGHNHQNQTFNGFRNGVERVELIAVAALEEVEDLNLLTLPLRNVGRDLQGCWRIGALWTEVLKEANPADERAMERKIEEHLESLDEKQLELDGFVRQPALDACLFLGRSARQGFFSIRPKDAVGITATFLTRYADSSLGTAFRENLLPRPGPTRFHLGVAERRFDPRNIVRRLRQLFWGESLALLDGSEGSALAEEEHPLAALDPSTFLPTDMQEAQRALDDLTASLRAAVALGDGMPTGLKGAERNLDQCLETVRRLRLAWIRAKDDAYRHLMQWELSPEPLREWTVSGEVVESHRRFGLSFLMLLPALAILLRLALGSTPGIFETGIALVSLAACIVAFLIPRRVIRAQATGTEQNPEYETYRESGRRWKHRFELAGFLIGSESSHGEQGDAEPSGLSRLDYDLSMARLNVQELRKSLRENSKPVLEKRSFSEQAFFNEDSIRALYERNLERSSLLGTSEARRQRRDPLSFLGKGWLASVLEGAQDRVLSDLDRASRELFDRHSELSLAGTFGLVDGSQGANSEALGTFFEELSRGASLLWREVDQLSSERCFLRYGSPWTPALIGRGTQVIENCEAQRTHREWCISLFRIARGPSWIH